MPVLQLWAQDDGQWYYRHLSGKTEFNQTERSKKMINILNVSNIFCQLFGIRTNKSITDLKMNRSFESSYRWGYLPSKLGWIQMIVCHYHCLPFSLVYIYCILSSQTLRKEISFNPPWSKLKKTFKQIITDNVFIMSLLFIFYFVCFIKKSVCVCVCVSLCVYVCTHIYVYCTIYKFILLVSSQTKYIYLSVFVCL